MPYDFFINLANDSIAWWAGKMIGFPLIAFSLVFIIQGILVRMRVGNRNDPFPIRSNFMLMYGIIIGGLLVNAGWFCVVLLNNPHTFIWSSFPLDSSNTYFGLSPFIFTQVCLAVFFFRIHNTLKQV
jgi:hypothetical protein